MDFIVLFCLLPIFYGIALLFSGEFSLSISHQRKIAQKEEAVPESKIDSWAEPSQCRYCTEPGDGGCKGHFIQHLGGEYIHKPWHFCSLTCRENGCTGHSIRFKLKGYDLEAPPCDDWDRQEPFSYSSMIQPLEDLRASVSLLRKVVEDRLEPSRRGVKRSLLPDFQSESPMSKSLKKGGDSFEKSSSDDLSGDEGSETTDSSDSESSTTSSDCCGLDLSPLSITGEIRKQPENPKEDDKK